MASEAAESASPESLICPLCLDVFEDAALLSCGHTFCRKCLKMHDASHPDREHMECPLCRSDTKLHENRVEGLPANVTVNGLVDDYRSKPGGILSSMAAKSIRCTVCTVKGEAVSFCKECNYYMCDSCHSGHNRMSTVFADHQVLSMKEIGSGRFNIHKHPERCLLHPQGTKDLFCEDCQAYICFKCVVVAHRDHNITNRSDFQRELQLKVDSLIERCKTRKTELEKNIQNTEACRKEAQTAVQKMETEISEAYEAKARQLEENKRLLLGNLQWLKKGFNDDLDALKAKDRQRIKSVVSSIPLIANDRLRCLEGDSLTAHNILCDELEHILKENPDDTTAGVVSKTAQETEFKPAETLIHLGEITGKHMVEATQEHTIQIKNVVDLRGIMYGMTSVSDDEVVIGYDHGADKVSSEGNTSQLLSQDDWYNDLAHQSLTGNTVVSRYGESDQLLIYSPEGSLVHSQKILNCSYYPAISSNDKGEIIIANRKDCIMIYDPSISTKLCSITTKDEPWQAFETRSGVIIASTCDALTNPSKVTAYDRSGTVCDTLTARSGNHLYAAVDSHDRVYVASVNQGAGKVVITQYKMDGQKFKKVFKFEELQLTLRSISGKSTWCYMVCLSCDLLAFASSKKVYFIEVQPAK